ncbi:MAG TPA: zinc-ribbon domain containing protein [Chloroflexota bacterium]|jgi:CxxC-x17-CxxC domain-containing protein
MQSSYVDQTLQCRDCGNSFVWTAGEQDFYESKHLTNSPTRCPTCRAAAKRARESGGRVAAARPREFFPAICDRCGVQTQVPFLPRTDRPVYCSACYDQVRLSAASP